MKRGSVVAGDPPFRSTILLCAAGSDLTTEQLGETDVLVLREIPVYLPVAGVGPDLPTSWPDVAEIDGASFGPVPFEIQ